MPRLAIRVQPGAKANEIVGWTAGAQGGEVLKIQLRAAAVESQANAALLEFLAESLGLRPRQITLVRGEKIPRQGRGGGWAGHGIPAGRSGDLDIG